jgi:hypothetical protein
MAKTLAKLQARTRKTSRKNAVATRAKPKPRLHARSRSHGRSRRSMSVTSERKTFGRMACGATRNTAISA